MTIDGWVSGVRRPRDRRRALERATKAYALKRCKKRRSSSRVEVGVDHVVKLPDEVPVGPAEIIVARGQSPRHASATSTTSEPIQPSVTLHLRPGQRGPGVTRFFDTSALAKRYVSRPTPRSVRHAAVPRCGRGADHVRGSWRRRLRAWRAWAPSPRRSAMPSWLSVDARLLALAGDRAARVDARHRAPSSWCVTRCVATTRSRLARRCIIVQASAGPPLEFLVRRPTRPCAWRPSPKDCAL